MRAVDHTARRRFRRACRMHAGALSAVLSGAATVTVGMVVLLSFAPPAPGTVPCPTVDSVGCYWDADTMGSEGGRSRTVGYDGAVQYWDECSDVTAYDSEGREVPVLGQECVGTAYEPIFRPDADISGGNVHYAK